jgi:monoamine oxidase
VTRRELLQTVAAGSTYAFWQSNAPAPRAAVRPSDALDVAVIGGGVSGAYVAWRLQTASAGGPVLAPLTAGRPGQTPVIGVFERADRVGGRLRSVVPPDMPHLRAELGGMRFPTTHVFVARLVEHLRLATKPFPVGNDANFYYLRGRRFRQREWGTPGVLPYQVAADDRTMSPDDLLIRAIEHYVPDARRLVNEAWEAVKTRPSAGGAPLRDLGFWSLMLQAKGSETLNLIRDAGGYGSFFRSWNAAEMMPWIMADFLGSPTYLTVRDGYDSIPKQMIEQLLDAGGGLFGGHRLRRVRRVEPPHADLLALDFEGSHGAALPTRYARHVVLALPRRALEQIAWDGIGVDHPRFRADIASVTPQPAAKIFMTYNRPWWRDLGISGGRSTTDLPIRQCYYVGTEAEQTGADRGNQGSLLMASYHDDDHTAFWSPFGSAHSPDATAWLDAGDRTLQEACRQIQEVHGPSVAIPAPSAGFYVNWMADPYGGAWHFWNPRTAPAEVIARMRQPAPEARVYVCNEAWSTDQGWVRGALRSAERLVQDKFSLPRPSWLPGDEYLGP